ncbi:DNA polymerase III subunit gamma and tau [Hoyosella sp. G463]|uniref:DNA polymerase III subunit gamma/tau n=1 Tax=Lolliginicoccus lacisalsi TaxID=2742202 RepID=A0A927JE75_9ACTN|nr:DNA polymerase III subunit gamma and tau [Lolliginicoccus lacisalsi]
MALSRKYRPATFAEVVGQEHVTEPLSVALRAGRINHAYLFSGPRGCGKTSSARILARSLNCVDGPTPEPCGTCSSCEALGPGGPGNLDVIELDAASHGGVDDTRELRDRAFYAPAESRYRVFIVDEAHMVTNAGFNALLKIVEEPPEHLIFIFATTEPEKVLPTIKSRTHHYPFRLLPPPVMRGLVEQICGREGVRVDDAVFPLVIKAGGGSPRDTLSVLDQLLAGAGDEGITYNRALALLGVTDMALIDAAVDALAENDAAGLYDTINRVMDAGFDPRRFAADLLERFRDLILVQAVPEAAGNGLVDAPADQLERLREDVDRFGPATLTRYAELLHDGLADMRGATAPRLLLEVLCARMLLPSASDSEGSLLQRLEALERGAPPRSVGSASAGSAAPASPGAASGASAASAEQPPRFQRPSRRPATEKEQWPAAGPGEDIAEAAPTAVAPTAHVPAAEPPAPKPSAAAAPVPQAPAAETPAQQPGAAHVQQPQPGLAGGSSAEGAPAPESEQGTANEQATGPGQGSAAEPAGHDAPEAVLDARSVEAAWPRICAEARKSSKTIEVMLSGARVTTTEGRTVVLSHETPALAARLQEPRNAAAVQAAFSAVLGIPEVTILWSGQQPAAPAQHAQARPALSQQGSTQQRSNPSGPGPGSQPRPEFVRRSRASAPQAPGGSQRSKPQQRSPAPPTDDIPPPEDPGYPDDPGPGEPQGASQAGARMAGSVGPGPASAHPATSPPAQSAPEDEDEMLAEAHRDTGSGDPAARRDPEEIAIELLANELGAKRID